MKPFYINSSIAMAFIAVCIAFAANMKAIGGSRVSGCWRANSLQIQVRDLANPASPTASEVFTPVYNSTACATVEAQLFTNQKEFLRVASGSLTQELGGDLTGPIFCCLELQAIANPNDALYQDVPFINLGDGLKKYQIIEVKCKQ